MRKRLYILADVLTAIRGILAFAIWLIAGLVVLFDSAASVWNSPDIVIWLFVIGELCDAFDGICARRWHYPDDGKKRWWRENASVLDQVTDIFLITATATYLGVRLGRFDLLMLGGVVALFCIIVECLKFHYYSKRLILLRRYIYLACIVLALFILLFATSWNGLAKGVAIAVIFIVGIFLMIVKRNRLTQDVTKL